MNLFNDLKIWSESITGHEKVLNNYNKGLITMFEAIKLLEEMEIEQLNK